MPNHITRAEVNKCGSEFDFFKIQNGKDGPQSEKNPSFSLNMQMERGARRKSQTPQEYVVIHLWN